MANEIFATNRFVVQVLSPVQIGEGETLNPLAFVHAGDEVLVIDEARLLRWVSSENRLTSLFANFAEKGGAIGKFLEERGKDPATLAAYRLPANLPPGAVLREIRTFMKNSENRPYLAGSSLKGSLRSALLRGALLADPEKRERADQTVAYHANQSPRPSSGGAQVDAQVFVPADVPRSKESNYDLNRVLVLHDSPPQPPEVLEVMEVQMLTYKTQGRLEIKTLPNGRPLPIHVEALPPGNAFTLDMTWQRNLLMGQAGAKDLEFKQVRSLMVYLPEYCRAASLHIIQQEIAFYHKYGAADLAGWFEKRRDQMLKSPDEIFLLPIGWGSGYDPKTITDLLDKATFETVADNLRNTSGLGRPGNRRESDWLGPELSPKSRKVVERPGKDRLPVGWVALRLMDGTGPGSKWMSQARLKLAAEKPTFPALEVSSPPQAAPKTAPQAASQPPAPARPAVKEQSVEPPVRLITTFNRPPEIGEAFQGEIFEITKGVVLLSIPGLEDTEAYAMLAPEDYPPLMRLRDGQQVRLQVISKTLEGGRAWRVRCRMI